MQVWVILFDGFTKCILELIGIGICTCAEQIVKGLHWNAVGWPAVTMTDGKRARTSS